MWPFTPSGILGSNVNTTGDSKLPDGYVLHPRNATAPPGKDMRRSLVYLAENSTNSTPWLHIPLTQQEIAKIQMAVWSHKGPYMLAWGPLWEGRWTIPGSYVRPNPYTSPHDLMSAHADSLWNLLHTGPNPLHPRKNLYIDIWSEFDLLDGQQELIKLWYPHARRLLKGLGIKHTISVLVEPDASTKRAIDSINWIYELGFGLPPIIDIHWNGATIDTVDRYHKFVCNQLKFFNKPIGIGEIDCFNGQPTKSEVKLLNDLRKDFAYVLTWNKASASI